MSLAPISRKSPFFSRRSPGGAVYCYRANLLRCPGSETEATTASRVQLHEIIHFLEHCGTPYGIVRDELHLRQLLLAEQFCREAPGTLVTPIYEWAQRTLDAGRAAGGDETGLMSRYVSPWTQAIHAEQVFDALADPYIRTVGIPSACQALLRSELPLDQIVHSDPDAIAGAPTYPLRPELRHAVEGAACPVLGWEHNGHIAPVALGAKQVSEAIAQIVEGLGETSGQALLDPDYYILPFLVAEKLTAQRRRDLGRERRRIGTTCLALADLALFTPIGPYASLRHDETCWDDVHPGYRFLAALEAVEKLDAWISTLDETVALMDAVCAHLRWPHPQSFLESSASLSSPSFEANRMSHLRRHQQACRLRREQFMGPYQVSPAFARNNDHDSFFDRFMPLVDYPPGRILCGAPDDDGENANATLQVRDCFRAHFFWNVMLLPGGANAACLPTGIQYDLYFENIRTPADFAHLFCERFPWASPRRFT